MRKLAITKMCSIPEFTLRWKDAKRRLGAERAGGTVRKFLEKHTRIIDLDPWAEAEKDIQEGQPGIAHSSGSFNPITYDVVVSTVEVAPTTKVPVLTFADLGAFVQVRQTTFALRGGVWEYVADLPQPGEGLQLEPWEKITTVTFQFTMPCEVAVRRKDVLSAMILP